MNKTKCILVGFAIFASILMFSTTCIAGPVREKASMDAVEFAEQELVSSVKIMSLKIQNDRYLKSLVDQISKDRRLNSLASAIENTEDFETKASLAKSYVDALKNNKVFNNLAAYFESTYSGDLQKLSDLFGTYQSVNTETEDFEILGAIPYPSGSPFQNDEPVIGGSGIDGTYSNGDVCLVGDGSHTILPSDSAEAQWVGFVHNMNGEMYIPGFGWVPEDDDFWNKIQDMLEGIIGFVYLICLVSWIVSWLSGLTIGLKLCTITAAIVIILAMFYAIIELYIDPGESGSSS